MPAGTAEDRLLAELIHRPDRGMVIGQLRMTFEARIPSAAAFEFDGDDVERGVPMRAADPGIDIDTMHLVAVD